MNVAHKYDCFLSHASEDKEDFAEPLALEMQRLGVRVWYDKFSLKVGDSLHRSIDEGLSRSQYGVLVLSEAFLAKPWPDYELRGLVAREIGKEKIILPVWYKIARETILDFSPTLADKLAIIANGDDVNSIARQLIEVVRPDLFDHLHRIEMFETRLNALPIKDVAIAEINTDTKIQHDKLTPQQMVRIRNIRLALQDVDEQPFSLMILNFKKDLRINAEIFIWEGIAAAFGTYKNIFKPALPEQREVFSGSWLARWVWLIDSCSPKIFRTLIQEGNKCY